MNLLTEKYMQMAREDNRDKLRALKAARIHNQRFLMAQEMVKVYLQSCKQISAILDKLEPYYQNKILQQYFEELNVKEVENCDQLTPDEIAFLDTRNLGFNLREDSYGLNWPGDDEEPQN